MWLNLRMNGILWAYLRATDAQHAQRRGDGVAAALDGEFDDLFGVEVNRVRRERCACRMLDTLVNRQNRDVARPTQAAMIEQLLQAAQHTDRAIRVDPDAIDKIRAGQVQHFFGDRFALVAEQIFGFFPKQGFNDVQR